MIGGEVEMSLTNRETAMISIGVSVGVNCQPCLKYHVAHATKLGMTEQEIQDAINAGKVVRSGAANNMNNYIAELLKGKETISDSAENACCGCSQT